MSATDPAPTNTAASAVCSTGGERPLRRRGPAYGSEPSRTATPPSSRSFSKHAGGGAATGAAYRASEGRRLDRARALATRGGGGGRLADRPAGLLRGPALAGGPAYPLRRPPAAGHRVPGPTRTASAVALSLAGVGGERKLACQGRTSRRPRGQAKCRRVAAEVSWRYRL